MRLRRLHVSNFRGFADAELVFEDDLTVLVGVNGSGKTSLLDAMVCFASGAVAHGSSRLYLDRRELMSEDVRIGYASATLRVDATHDGEVLSWSAQRDAGEPRGNQTFEGRYWNPDGSFIAVVFYPAARLVARSETAFRREDPEADPVRIYYGDWLSAPRTGFHSFFRWFKDREDVENEQKVARSDLSHEDPQLSAIRRAVTSMLPGFTQLRVQRDPLHLVVRKGETQLLLDQLSEGERDLLVMIADLARRLAIAHPTLADPLQGEAVVLVDEIELHLHPGWQHRVLRALRTTFPQVQFVVTTHAPLVLGEVPSRCIRLVKDFRIEPSPVATEGRDSNRILEFLMGTPARPADVEDLFVRLRQDIDEEWWGGAWEAIDHLRARLGEDDPDVSYYTALLPARDDAHAAE